MENEIASVTVRLYPSDRDILNEMAKGRPGKRKKTPADIIHAMLMRRDKAWSAWSSLPPGNGLSKL